MHSKRHDSSPSVASSSQAGLPNQVSVLFSREQRKRIVPTESYQSTESSPLLQHASPNSKSSFYTALQPGQSESSVDVFEAAAATPSLDNLPSARELANVLWPTPRIMRTGGQYHDEFQFENRETEWSELFLDLVFASCFLQLGQSFVNGGTLHIGHYILLFFVFWGFWQDATNYSTRFGTDDVPHMVFFTVFTGGILGMGVSLHDGGMNGEHFDWFCGSALVAISSLVIAYVRIISQPPTRNIQRFAVATCVRAIACAVCWGVMISPLLHGDGELLHASRIGLVVTTVIFQHGLDLVAAIMASCCYDGWPSWPATHRDVEEDNDYVRQHETQEEEEEEELMGTTAVLKRYASSDIIQRNGPNDFHGSVGGPSQVDQQQDVGDTLLRTMSEHQITECGRSKQRVSFNRKDEILGDSRDQKSTTSMRMLCSCHILPPMLLPLHMDHFAQRIGVLMMAMLATCVPVLTYFPPSTKTESADDWHTRYGTVIGMFYAIACLRKLYLNVEEDSAHRKWTGHQRFIAFWWLYSHMALALGISLLLVAMQTFVMPDDLKEASSVKRVDRSKSLYWYCVGLATCIGALANLLACNNLFTPKLQQRGADQLLVTGKALLDPLETDNCGSQDLLLRTPPRDTRCHSRTTQVTMLILVYACVVALFVVLAFYSDSEYSELLVSVVSALSLTVLVVFHLFDQVLTNTKMQRAVVGPA